MTLGSLFDGIGGFPLAGSMYGITPLWAAEIEPFPIRVTKARFPDMVHLGSVTEIDGGNIPPVDVITFGSPCQDLSVAGLQKGIHDGTRSSLFFEAIRIIKEMRARDRAAGRSDEHCRPRFAAWENVPGAFSSNGGDDFRAVLQAFCSIRGGHDHIVPRPPKGKWGNAGCIVGDGWSIAWRVYDAQYWPGTPQRRKRIYLIADFATGRAGEILFEREGLRGDYSQGGEAREGTASDAQGGAGRGSAAGFKANQGSHAGGIGWQEGLACTLNADCPGLEPTVCYSLKGNAIDRETRQNRRPWTERVSYTLDATDRHGVVALDGRNMTGYSELSGTLSAKANGGQSLNCINPSVYDTTQITSPLNYSNPKAGDACHPLAAQQNPPLMVGNGQLNNITMDSVYNTLDCMHDQHAVMMAAQPPRKYTVRRLTPLECLRLQGYPDWWFDGVKGSDSAKYKACGNSLAIPCAADVMRRIAMEVSE